MARVQTRLQDDGTFVLTNYHQAAPFASFLPGIAGALGVPIWVFYCNRGQAITSCGVRDKDGAMLEYHPAEMAYQRVFNESFRTLIWNHDHYYESFRDCGGIHAERRGHTQRMHVRAHELELIDENPAEGLRTRVVYFTLPTMPQGGLVRGVTITNIGRRTRRLRVADGVARLVPGCTPQGTYKNMANTHAGMVETRGMADGVVFSRSCIAAMDETTLDFDTAGNYLVTQPVRGVRGAVRMIGDPRLVFGDGADPSAACAFIAHAGVCRGPQREVGYMPCAFAALETTLAAGATCEWISLLGHIATPRAALQLRAQLKRPGWVATKRAENAALIADIEDRMWTVTTAPVFDHYCRQTYLDNVLRGGLPVSLGTQIFHLYFRRHGDMERDYNWFTLDPAYYSQGNASYRDINQNRRTDVLFNAAVGATNVRTFFNALQTDGNNPLGYEGTAFDVPAAALPACGVTGPALAELTELLKKPATPGRLATFALKHRLPVAPFLEKILAQARRVDRYGGSDGYWSDHWTYCADLLENYLQVYPDRAQTALHDDCSYTYCDVVELMLPRSLRFTCDARSGEVRQHNALTHDAEKARQLAARSADATCVRTQHGAGAVYYCTLFQKLLCLVAIKTTALDPDGLGIEMRGNRPGWNDALNGLPGLIGSSLNETAELLHLARLTKRHAATAAACRVFTALAELLRGLAPALACADEPPARWQALNELREQYLSATRLGVSGADVSMTSAELTAVLDGIIAVLQHALDHARNARTGLYDGYFYYSVTAHKKLTNADGTPVLRDGRRCVWPLAFERVTLPAYLEPQVHVMKTLDAAACRALHRAVGRSPLYDRQLKMYVLNAPLARASKEIGRANVFPPGWLENESVWLHMEYKYLLALLQADLHAEFFAACATALIPHQPPQRYGRSPLENSSFLATSAHPDKQIHGAGFYARLSGATVEFISMWLAISGAARMFSLAAGGALQCRLQPILPATYFTRAATTRVLQRGTATQTVTIPKNACAFVLLGGTLVVYHNPLRRDTFGPRAVTPQRYVLTDRDGAIKEVAGATLDATHADAIRAGRIARMDVQLG
jgi:hypothetical protein